MPESPEFAEILRILREQGVDFIIVGGVSAVLHGAPVTTFDLDIVHSREPDNLDRLLGALRILEARYRFGRSRRIADLSRLASPGHQLLMTRFGPLDVLGMIGKKRGYPELLPHSAEVSVAGGIRVRVLDLDMLIRVKSETAGEKDRAVLPILKQLRREKSKTKKK